MVIASDIMPISAVNRLLGFVGRAKRDEAGNVVADQWSGSYLAPFYRIVDSFRVWRDVSALRYPLLSILNASKLIVSDFSLLWSRPESSCFLIHCLSPISNLGIR